MKKEALEVLKNRRSIRKFQSRQISAEELDTVLEAGTYAPTAGGRQAPVIVAVQDAETVAALDAMNAKVMGNASAHPYYGAPTILLVMAPEEDAQGELDCSAIGGNLLNARLCRRARVLLDPPQQGDVRIGGGQGAPQKMGPARNHAERLLDCARLCRLPAPGRRAQEIRLHHQSLTRPSRNRSIEKRRLPRSLRQSPFSV